MKALRLILSLLVSVLSVQAEEISLNAHVVDLPAEVITLPPTMAGQLALVRETIEVAEVLQTVLETPDVYVNPQATVCLIAEKWLLPRWRALSELPSERLRELLLLVDAIDWQSAWVLDAAEADSCVSMPREEDTTPCLERLVKVAQVVERQMKNGDSPELQAVLVSMVGAMGGGALLKLPAPLLEERWVRDYKTAYSFLAGFKSALEQGDAAAMASLHAYTDYLLQSEADCLRVDALAAVYASVCQAEYKVRPAQFCIDTAMQQAMQPFLERLPALRGVLPGKMCD